ARLHERLMLGEERALRLAPARAGESRVKRLERCALDRPHRWIVEEPPRGGGGNGGPQRVERGLERLVSRKVGVENVDEDRIEEPAVGRVVWTCSLTVVR